MRLSKLKKENYKNYFDNAYKDYKNYIKKNPKIIKINSSIFHLYV